jgi:hypothetical protein
MTEKIDTMAGTANDYAPWEPTKVYKDGKNLRVDIRHNFVELTDALIEQVEGLEAALREIANLPTHELGRAYKISREVLGIKVGDEA